MGRRRRRRMRRLSLSRAGGRRAPLGRCLDVMSAVVYSTPDQPRLDLFNKCINNNNAHIIPIIPLT
jgi:hypothetical protein